MKTLLLALAALVVWAVPAHGAPTLQTGPVPGWVDPVSVPRDPVPPASAAGVYYAVMDRQGRYQRGEAAWYAHSAEVALSTDGVGRISRVAVQFEPSYQTVTMHRVRVIRDGKARDVLDPKAFLIAPLATDSRTKMYMGLVEASYEIPDVRIGDIVEIAYTIRGGNPVFGGAVMADWPISFPQPVGHLGYRLLAPASTRLAIGRVGTDREITRQSRGGQQELRYRARDVPAQDFDSELPGWFDAQARFRISSFADWRAVSDWAMPLYDDAAQVDEEILALADQLRQEHPTAMARARAATRFVQDEIRYVAIMLGPHTHAPHPAPQVLRQRYGDCKDKSTLLATLLRELEIPAQPALVSTYRGRGLDDWLATPWAFDHVIVWALIDGRETWIDPTMTEVRGTTLEPPNYERALVISATTAELAEIEQPELTAPLIVVRETFDAPTSGPGRAGLTVVSTFRGREANAFRQRLASQSREELERDYLNYYTRRYPAIESVGELEVTDDAEANEITVRESYAIPKFYGDDGKELITATDVAGALRKPSDLQRTGPWSMTHPTWYRQIIRVDVAPGFDNQIDEITVDNEFFRYAVSSRLEGGQVVVEADLRSKADAVPAGDIPRYVAAVDEAAENAEWELEVGRNSSLLGESTPIDSKLGALFIVIFLAGVVAFIVLYNRAERRHARMTPPPTTGPPPSQLAPLPSPQDNGIAIAALVMGLVGFGLILVPFLNILTGALALIFGIIGARRARAAGGFRRGFASAGIALGAMVVLFGTLLLVHSITTGDWFPDLDDDSAIEEPLSEE